MTGVIVFVMGFVIVVLLCSLAHALTKWRECAELLEDEYRKGDLQIDQMREDADVCEVELKKYRRFVNGL
jgi:hypothetical protein